METTEQKQREMEEAEILELYELSYSDLMLLSSNNVSTSSDELERLESTRRTIMETLGPSGPGLLAISGVPNAFVLRQALLPLARKLALLKPDDRKRILKEHNLGSDVPLKNPARSVSSFARQLKYMQDVETTRVELDDMVNHHLTSEQDHLEANTIKKGLDHGFMELGNAFEKLGHLMMELVLSLARICDKAIGGQELEQSLLESCTAKGRLIHYHSALDGILLKEAERKNGSSKRRGNNTKAHGGRMINERTHSETHRFYNHSEGIKSSSIGYTLWQQWHYDYGIFTVLTDPMFLLPSFPETTDEDQTPILCDQDSPSPSGHTYLQIFDPYKNNVLMVKAPPKSFIIQVGESADILSKGKLRSTLHCVCRPTKLDNLCRETFVVFLQPAWGKTFSTSDYLSERCSLDGKSLESPSDDTQSDEKNKSMLIREIQKIIPPLSSRLKDGMTFAEFSRETTKQYYGGSGLQSNKH